MNNTKLKITILLLSLLQMGSIFMSPIIGDLVAEFSMYSASTCQMLMTFPNLVVVIMSIVTGRLDSYISRKNLAIIACICVILGALGLFTFHTSLIVMYAFAGLFGIGIGIILPLGATLISVYFTEDQQGQVYGLQNSFANLGGVALNLLGGTLAGIAWYFDFLAPLIIIPAFIMVLISVPNEKGIKASESKEKAKIPSIVYLYVVIAAIFGIIFNTMPTNISIFVSENSLGGSSFSSIVTAVFLCGGAIAGMFFNTLNKKFGEIVIAIAFLNLGLGLLICSQATIAILLLIGAFIGGCSMSLFMSRVTLSISAKTNPIVTPMALSLVLSSNNLGNFISPTVIGLLPGTLVSDRFLIVGIIALIGAAIVGYLMQQQNKIA
ncbi:MAG: MFS transporter [Erysipelotrichaceae bacterium]|nr:MFS transporter [Erysipelotrichaceae bacterium]